MTDGPFKNLNLNRRWKSFIAAVQNDVMDIHERCDLASHALVHDILTPENLGLLKDLEDYECKEQLDIDVLSEIETIFRCHSLTPFAVSLKKAIAFFLAKHLPFSKAFECALKETINTMFSVIKSRVEEECILAYENGKIRLNQFDNFFRKLRRVFSALNLDTVNIFEAILTRNKKAFKTNKKLGLDEGPGFEI